MKFVPEMYLWTVNDTPNEKTIWPIVGRQNIVKIVTDIVGRHHRPTMSGRSP